LKKFGKKPKITNHLTQNYFIYVFEFFRKILIEIQQDFVESELTKSLIYNSKESKFRPRNKKISVKPCNQERKRKELYS
jgi:hypothetical protein